MTLLDYPLNRKIMPDNLQIIKWAYFRWGYSLMPPFEVINVSIKTFKQIYLQSWLATSIIYLAPCFWKNKMVQPAAPVEWEKRQRAFQWSKVQCDKRKLQGPPIYLGWYAGDVTEDDMLLFLFNVCYFSCHSVKSNFPNICSECRCIHSRTLFKSLLKLSLDDYTIW